MNAFLSAATVRLPIAVVSITQLDNGYQLTMTKRPKLQARPANAESAFAADQDALIDHLVDGLGALVRSIHDKGAGETWKQDDDRAKIRDGFKALFPQFLEHVGEVEQPSFEQMVFESKEKLFDYLNKNL